MTSSDPHDKHRLVAGWLAAAKSAVAFTGAGISTESGIPDFRSPGGIWATSQPVYFEEFLRSPQARYEYWRQKSIAHDDFEGSHPNAGHLTLGGWEQAARLQAVITQNIDGLHQDAGNQDVVELHGTSRFVACLDCDYRCPAEEPVRQFIRDNRVPPCPGCGGRLKHATISFGQPLDEAVLERAVTLATNCDLLLAMGSSLVVEPAASLPRLAQQHQARLVIVNRDPTPLDPLADVVFHAGIGETLTAIDRQLSAG